MTTLKPLPRALALTVALLVPVVCGFACEPEVGMPCDDDERELATLIAPTPGFDDVVRDVRFDNCSEALCASTDGSRPYCTVRCTGDGDCPVDEGFACANGTPLADEPLFVCVGTRAIVAARDEAMGRAR